MTLDPGGKLGETDDPTELGIVTVPEDDADGRTTGGLLDEPGMDSDPVPTPLLVEGGRVLMYVPPPIFAAWLAWTGVGLAMFPELTVGRLLATTAETCGVPVGMDMCPDPGLIPAPL